MLSNAFSAEFGWTAGPALNIVTKSGTNDAARRRRCTWAVPAAGRRRRSRPTASARRRCRRCVTPATLDGDQPGGHSGRAEPGLRHRSAAPIVKDKTFFFATGRLHAQDRTTFLSTTLPAFVLPPDGSLDYVGQLPADARQRPRSITSSRRSQTLMVRVNFDRFYDTNPNDAVGGTNAPSVARKYSRRSVDGAGQPHVGARARTCSTKRGSRT